MLKHLQKHMPANRMQNWLETAAVRISLSMNCVL